MMREWLNHSGSVGRVEVIHMPSRCRDDDRHTAAGRHTRVALGNQGYNFEIVALDQFRNYHLKSHNEFFLVSQRYPRVPTSCCNTGSSRLVRHIGSPQTESHCPILSIGFPTQISISARSTPTSALPPLPRLSFHPRHHRIKHHSVHRKRPYNLLSTLPTNHPLPKPLRHLLVLPILPHQYMRQI